MDYEPILIDQAVRQWVLSDRIFHNRMALDSYPARVTPTTAAKPSQVNPPYRRRLRRRIDLYRQDLRKRIIDRILSRDNVFRNRIIEKRSEELSQVIRYKTPNISNDKLLRDLQNNLLDAVDKFRSEWRPLPQEEHPRLSLDRLVIRGAP
jgi:hypothetical protein